MENFKKKDIDLHNKKYEDLVIEDPKNIFKPRVKILSEFQNKVQRIYGNVLDIGAGSGYASIWLAQNSDADKIICLENSKIAVENLIPKNIKYYGVENKVETLLGSFEELPFNNFFDFIISMGSIHHCNCLYTSMKSINSALKNKGYLIMNEPSMSNTTSNVEYINKYNTDEIIYGTKMKNYERNDRFFREAEYITAALYSGFDLKFQRLQKKIYFENFSKKVNRLKTLFLEKKFSKMLQLSIFFPFKYLKSKIFKTYNEKKEHTRISNKENSTIKVRSLIFFFQKDVTNYIPHIWEKLK